MFQFYNFNHKMTNIFIRLKKKLRHFLRINLEILWNDFHIVPYLNHFLPHILFSRTRVKVKKKTHHKKRIRSILRLESKTNKYINIVLIFSFIYNITCNFSLLICLHILLVIKGVVSIGKCLFHPKGNSTQCFAFG